MNERSFSFGDNNGLVGTICLPPARQATPRVGVVLFNAGVVHRIGPHRINVRLARRLASKGIPSIRFDLAGQGDSARAVGNRPFERQAVEDIRAAMDFLGHEAKVQRFALFGFCSGGVHSYETAKVDARVAGLLMYDTYIYPTSWSRINRYLNKIKARGLLTPAGEWLGRKAASMLVRLRTQFRSGAVNSAAARAALFTYPSKKDFARTLTRLSHQGMKIGMIYSGGFEHYNYRNQFADAFKNHGIDDFVTNEFLCEMDHTATLTSQQSTFMQAIERWCVELNESLGVADNNKSPSHA